MWFCRQQWSTSGFTCTAGNEAAFRRMLDERAPRVGRPLFESVWGLEATLDGTLALPADAAADNPLLAVMLARLKEGCRLLEHAGEHATMGMNPL